MDAYLYPNLYGSIILMYNMDMSEVIENKETVK